MPTIDQMFGHLRRQRRSPILHESGPVWLVLTLVTNVAVIVATQNVLAELSDAK